MSGNPRPRSKAYPARSLNDAIEFTKRVHELGGKRVSEASIATDMGIKNTNNAKYSYALSACMQFGLLEREKRGGPVSITPLAMRILVPRDEQDDIAARQTAVQQPDLYEELIGKFQNVPVPAAEKMIGILVNDFSIIESKAKHAAECFIESLTNAALMDADRKICGAELSTNLDMTQPPLTPHMQGGISHPHLSGGGQTGIQTSTQQRVPAQMLSYPIKLTHGIGTLTLPDQITEGDLRRVKMLLDVVVETVPEATESVPDASESQRIGVGPLPAGVQSRIPTEGDGSAR